MADIQSPTAEIRRGKKKEERKNKRQGENIYGLPYYIGRPQISVKLQMRLLCHWMHYTLVKSCQGGARRWALNHETPYFTNTLLRGGKPVPGAK